MVKRGGIKRKIPMEKIEKKTSRGPCYSKRCKGIFGKASQLCLLSGAQIAVLATPMSDNSNVSFYSFGHSSVDTVVSAFLSGNRPLVPFENNKRMREDIGVCFTRKALGLDFWWEDETLTVSRNPLELSDAVDSMSKLLKDVKKLKKSDHLVSHQEPDQTLTTTPEICCISDDFLQNNDTQIMPNSEAFCNTDSNKNGNALPDDNDIEMDFDQLIDFETTSESLLPYHGFINTSFESLLSSGVFESTQELQEFAASLLTTSDSMDPTMFSDSQPVKDGDHLVFQDFAATLLATSDSMDPSMFSDPEPVKDGDLVLQNRGFNDDHLHFSDIFNELSTIATL